MFTPAAPSSVNAPAEVDHVDAAAPVRVSAPLAPVAATVKAPSFVKSEVPTASNDKAPVKSPVKLNDLKSIS